MVSPLLERLIDDAAMFPPGNAPIEQAVPGHAGHREASYGELVGPFLVSDQRLPDLEKQALDGLAIGVIVTGGAGAIGPALTWASRMPVQVRAVEAALRDEPELARNARRVTMAYDQARQTGTLSDQAHAYVEVPRLPGWENALDVLAETGDRAKLRTGGDAPPNEHELASFIEACLDRELPFKLTAGLHHAARNTSPEGYEQHGFLNVLLATRAGLDGTDPTEILAEREGTVLAQQVRALDDAAAASTRRWFASFGSCSIAEPVDDLTTLGLLDRGR